MPTHGMKIFIIPYRRKITFSVRLERIIKTKNKIGFFAVSRRFRIFVRYNMHTGGRLE